MTISGGASCWSKLKKQTSRSAGMSSVKIYFLRSGISVGDLVEQNHRHVFPIGGSMSNKFTQYLNCF
jgi:hypothetical protein